MNKSNSGAHKAGFITDAEYREFQKSKRVIPRTLLETFLDQPSPDHAADRRRPALTEVRLLPTLRDELKRVTSGQSKGFACVSIEVKEGDGTKWNAEAVNQLIGENFSQLKRWIFTQNKTTDDSLPVIAGFIGMKAFLRLAVKHRLTPSFISFLSLRSWMTPVIVLAAFCLTFALRSGEMLLKVRYSGSNISIGQVFLDPIFILVTMGLVTLGLGSQLVTTVLTTRTKSKSIEKLASRLGSPEAHTDRGRDYDNFVDDIAEHMQSRDFPRAAIISSFEQLDYTTKRVIDRYFLAYSGARIGSEIWIVFESQAGERFSSLVLENHRSGGYANTRLFEQKVLTPIEKRELIQLLNLPDDAVEYTTVKQVCHPARRDDPHVQALFRDYLVRHPRQEAIYGGLDFAYLLSLTADNISLRRRFLLTHLLDQSVLRSKLLRQFLRGSRLNAQEFRDRFTELEERLPSLLLVKQDGDLTELQTVPEITNVLIEMADELKLPDAGLGHLFWCLFWYDWLQHRPVEAFWVRKLARHLLKASASEISDEQSYAEVLDRMFDAFLFAIDGCMTASWFEEIRGLLKGARFILQDEAVQRLDKYESRLLKLLRKTWQTYSILGDQELLNLILDVYGMLHYDAQPAPLAAMEPLESLFFESVLLPPERRAKISPDFFTRAHGRPAAGEPISDYARARAAWIALAIGPSVMQTGSDVCGFITALDQSDNAVARIGHDACNRISHLSASEDNVRLTDVMTLSTSLWCGALRLSSAFSQRRVHALESTLKAAVVTSGPAGGPADESAALALAWDAIQAGLRGDFTSLLEMAEDAALLATEVKRESSDPSQHSGVDYLMNGLAKELCAISLAAVLTAHHSLARHGLSPVDTDMAARINKGIVQLSAQAVNYQLPAVHSAADLSSPELISKVDSLMNLCAIIWKKFALLDLSDLMAIRRIHFNAACRQDESGDLPAYNSLIQSLGDAINDGDFSGIMANLAVAETLEAARELAAHYLIRAATIALNGNFGDQLKDQLAIVATAAGYSYGLRLDPFVNRLIAGTNGVPNLLFRFLKSIPEEQLESKMMAFLPASNSMARAEDGARTREILTAVAAGITSPEVKADVEALIDVFATGEAISRGEPVDAARIVEAWAGKEATWKYAWILQALLSNGYSTSELRKASRLVLNREAAADKINSYFLLSLVLAQESARAIRYHDRLNPGMAPDAGAEVAYLKASLPTWES
ncbi:MAG TPA: hypothetical protein VJX67_10955, partial [Blastocatellia bacterium]|nr:hypothetical protein [Blastocatellia bacterium]